MKVPLQAIEIPVSYSANGKLATLESAHLMELCKGHPVYISLKDTTKELVEVVTDYMNQKGIVRRNLQGFHYLRTAIMLCVENFGLVDTIGNLYREIAKKHDTTHTRVEKSIRHTIESEMQLNAVPNSEFIAIAADEIRLKIRVAKSTDECISAMNREG